MICGETDIPKLIAECYQHFMDRVAPNYMSSISIQLEYRSYPNTAGPYRRKGMISGQAITYWPTVTIMYKPSGQYIDYLDGTRLIKEKWSNDN